jgi:hypothetical protein
MYTYIRVGSVCCTVHTSTDTLLQHTVNICMLVHIERTHGGELPYLVHWTTCNIESINIVRYCTDRPKNKRKLCTLSRGLFFSCRGKNACSILQYVQHEMISEGILNNLK